jgi:uncharacterized OB-fold protein
MAGALRIRGGIGADEPYWRALEAGEFQLSACGGCSRWLWPAHFRCGECGCWDITWKPIAATGLVYTWTRNHAVSDAVKVRRDSLPYVTLLVELQHAGGARVAGVLAGSDDGLRIGAPVVGEIAPASERSFGYATMCWRLAGAGGAGP